MSQLMQELWGSSHLSAGHAAYLENLYETYLTNPENLSKEWRDFFSNLPRGSSKNGDVSHQSVINEFKNLSRGAVLAKEEIDERQGKITVTTYLCQTQSIYEKYKLIDSTHLCSRKKA